MNRYDSIMTLLFDAIRWRPEEDFSLTEQDLLKVEKSLNAKLPEDYREFLRNYGWSNVHRSFRMSNGELGHIDYFKGISWNDSDLIADYNFHVHAIPYHILEIGSSDAGAVFMSLKEGEKGTIYFYDDWEFTKEKFDDNLIFVANSFDEFMQLLQTQR